jgi:hypothetical protein
MLLRDLAGEFTPVERSLHMTRVKRNNALLSLLDHHSFSDGPSEVGLF